MRLKFFLEVSSQGCFTYYFMFYFQSNTLLYDFQERLIKLYYSN